MLPDIIKKEGNTQDEIHGSEDSLDSENTESSFMSIREFAELKSIIRKILT